MPPNLDQGGSFAVLSTATGPHDSFGGQPIGVAIEPAANSSPCRTDAPHQQTYKQRRNETLMRGVTEAALRCGEADHSKIVTGHQHGLRGRAHTQEYAECRPEPPRFSYRRPSLRGKGDECFGPDLHLAGRCDRYP